MIGVWNCTVEVRQMPLHLVFHVEDLGEIRLLVSTSPVPLLEIIDTKVEGNKLTAKGRNLYFPDQVKIELLFSEDTFTGKMTMFGTELVLEGERGRGSSLAEDILTKVTPLRKKLVRPRTVEEIAEAVKQLLAKMTIEDKIGQMCQCTASSHSFGSEVESAPPEELVAQGKAGSVLGAFDIRKVYELQKIAVEQSPHKIPLFFNVDVIHGHQTIFPIPLAWSCSWDMEGIKEACAIAAKEAAASGITYNHGPMIDIARDARWGRIMEGAGEDPYLGSLIAKAQVEGFQGDDLFSEETIIACLKHFIAYGASEGGRDYNTVDISEGTLRNIYLPPFQAGIRAGAGSIMNAFNIYQGIPMAGNAGLLKDVLRAELGFDGILISDYGAIDEIRAHGCAKDNAASAKMALDAAMDIEMVTRTYANILPELIAEGLVKEEQLDDAVRRILTYKYRIGIMDDPFRYVRPEKEVEYHFNEEHLLKSRELAKKSIVLLKNNGVLPLKEHVKTAIIGPFGVSKDLLGSWQFSRYANDTVTIYQGLQAKGLTKEDLIYAPGCLVDNEIEGGFKEAIEAASKADVILLALGESSNMSGEAASRADITLPEVQRRLAKEMVKLKKPIILLLTNGRPIVLDWFDKHMDAIVETWFLGSQAGHAIADVITGDYNPAGRLTTSFPYHVGQMPLYYNHFSTGRPYSEDKKEDGFLSRYIDVPNDPLYPFGYGLSYTTFAYSEIALNKEVMTREESLHVSVTVTNAGACAGEEVVQLYIQDLYGSTVRPVKELKGFQKIYLEPGESREICFDISVDDLKFYTANRKYEAEAGTFKVYIGGNSKDVKEIRFELIDSCEQ